ncbi:hypothetical protein [Paracraurococcus lichenis]|uniref:Type IV secretion system protein VirB3 n=1 Tax=Paracraurococcus lichenis TaxID=3064888 RepID=A0ABT9E9E2_9PROT|nr:hypothetical protein [Paracraurococcus sp. LOR1-02]MDO9712817.1 hypothetical protein [Paracraurococcus sp. LOR1-02]
MSAPPDWNDDPPHSDPVYPISRAAAPGGVPLGLSIAGLVAGSGLAVLLHPFFLAALPIAWAAAQRWFNGDLKKLATLWLYLSGAWMTPDPVVTRPDGKRGRLWGGSTVSALPKGNVGGRPRHVALPRD